MMRKCPACDKSFKYVLVDNIDARTDRLGNGIVYKAITFSCPYCGAVLSVQLDPLAVNADLVKKLRK